jgi:hypothetical protein
VRKITSHPTIALSPTVLKFKKAYWIVRGVIVRFGGLMIIVLATGHKFRGFKPGRERRIFKDDRRLAHNFLRRVSEAIGPMS